MIDGGVHRDTVIRLSRSFLQHFIVQRMQVAGCAEHFPIFNTEGPVPGGFDNAGGGGIFEHDSGVVVDFRIDIGLDLMHDGGDGDGCLVVHQPGHEVSAIAAKIAAGAAAIFYRIGQPVEEIRAAADFFGSLVAVVDDHFAGVADGVLLVDHFKDLLVRVVPGRFVVGEHLDMVLFSEGGDAIRVFHGSCEGFLDHDGDAFGGAGLDDAEVFGDRVVCEDSIGVGMVDEIGQTIIEKGIGQLIIFLIAGDELRIRLCNSGDDHLSCFKLVHDVVHVVMGETGYSYA